MRPPVTIAVVLAACTRGFGHPVLLQDGCGALGCEGDGDKDSAFAAVQLAASLQRSGRGAVASVEATCLLAAPELSAAVRRFLRKMSKKPHPAGPAGPAGGGDSGAEVALVEAASRAGCNQAQLKAMKAGAQVAALVSMVESLGNLRLMPSRREPGDGSTTFVFESFDEHGRVGTGMLGQGCEDKSVSEVTVAVSQAGPFLWTNLTGASMPFKIGPPCVKTHLISGTMWPTKVTAEGMVGEIRAGFVNLRSTMTGTWSTGPMGFEGNLSVAFDELLDVEWTWRPEP